MMTTPLPLHLSHVVILPCSEDPSPLHVVHFVVRLTVTLTSSPLKICFNVTETSLPMGSACLGPRY